MGKNTKGFGNAEALAKRRSSGKTPKLWQNAEGVR
jgi:hypothetical protein